MLVNYHQIGPKKVYLADGIGRGDAYIRTNLGLWILKDVRHSPGLSKQLISVDQLDKEGHHITFVKNT